MKKIYPERRTFLKYDDAHIIGYLNEEIIKDCIIEDEGVENGKTVLETAYQYEGSETDGGTVMAYVGEPEYGKLADAIISTRYSKSDEMAIHRHRLESLESASHVSEDVLAKYDSEWEAYNDFCEKAKTTAKCWLAEA